MQFCAVKLVLLVEVLCLSLTNVAGIPLASFYPYGSTAGDTLLPPSDDGSSPAINLNIPFPFFDTDHSTLFVNNNGDISFTTPVGQYTPDEFPLETLAIIAPYWADVDTRGTGSVWYRETTNDVLLGRARDAIQSVFLDTNVDGFSLTLLFIATWDHVGYYDSHVDKTNTFQCVMATNGVNSYVIFLYADGEIQWTTGDASGGINGFGGTPAHVGFNAGDGIHFENVPGSQTSEIINIASASNVGIGGVWIFRVDEEDIVTGGCTSESDVIPTIAPRMGNMLGGTPVQVAGPCLQETDVITCAFDGAVVEGIYISDMLAVCVSPRLSSIGRVAFQLTVSTSGAIRYEGETIFFSVSPFQGHAVDFSSLDLLLDPDISLTVTWSPETIIPFEDPGNYSVDIILYEFDAVSSIWSERNSLATNVPNSGTRNITIRYTGDQSTNCNLNFDVCQVVIQVAVSTTASSSGFPQPQSFGLLHTGIWSGIAYLAVRSDLRQFCDVWFKSEPPNFGQEILQRVPSCPPTMQRAFEDSRFEEDSFSSVIRDTMYNVQWRNFFHEGTANCFRQIAFTSANSGSGQQCCYENNGHLITGSPSGGSVDRTAPNDGESLNSHFQDDVRPYIFCCKGPFPNCDAYYRNRPSSNGNEYELPVPACVYGDPHMVTLDGLKYTFNGKGEFTLIDSETANGNFTLQGRMIEVTGSSGNSVQATVFSALVGKQHNSDSVQFELSRRGIDVLVNGEIVAFNDVIEQDYNNVTLRARGNNSFAAHFSNGAYVEVKEENDIISLLLVSLPNSLQNTTHGLLGTYNGDTSDDLLPKFVDEAIPINSSLEVIHGQFGITWIINSTADSLFTYRTGEDWSSFYDPSFTPTYEPVFADPSLQAEAESRCGGDRFCLFDIAATGRTDVGLSTLDGSQNFELILQLAIPIVCDPPCENGACVANNTCNCAAGFEGDTCNQTVYTDCDVNITLCQNNADCLQHVMTYICICPPQFTGSLCEIDQCRIEDDKFKCENNECIELQLRCDGRVDCTDSSDELELICSNNFAPTFIDSENSSNILFIRENVDPSTVSAPLGVFSAVDEDIGIAGDLTLSLTGDGTERFRINSSGAVYPSVALDRETRDRYDLIAVVQDKGTPALTSTLNITIYVLDDNDNAPVFSQPVFEFDAREGGYNVTTFLFTVVAEDADEDDNITYSFVGPGGTTPLAIDSNTGAISLIVDMQQPLPTLDQESQPYYDELVMACDTMQHCSFVPVLLYVSDRNDNVPLFALESYQVTIYDDYLAGTTILRPVAHDRDSAALGSIMYSLSETSDLFTINSYTAEISLVRDIQLSDIGQMMFQVCAYDGTLESCANVTIIVLTGAGEELTRFNSSYYFFEWPENNNTFEMDLSSSFDEATVDFTFTPENTFVQASGHSISLNASLDREVLEFHTVQVSAPCVSCNSPDGMAYANIVLKVTDVNDNPPTLLINKFYLMVPEDDNFTFSVGQFVIDNDTDVNRVAVWSLNGDEGDFTIDQNGVISLNNTLDREIIDSYALTATVSDPEIYNSNSSATLFITVIDVNNNAPVFNQSEGTGVQLLDVAEPGLVVYQLDAIDEDSGENGLFFFFLEDEDDLPFELDPVTGDITLTESLNFEQQNTYYSLVIQALDQGFPQLTAETIITVRVFNKDPMLIYLNASSEAVLMPNNSVIQPTLSQDLVISCASELYDDLLWSTKGSLSFRDTEYFREANLFTSEQSFGISAIIFSNTTSLGTISCVSAQAGAAIDIHLSHELCMCSSPVGELGLGIEDTFQACAGNQFGSCDCTGLDCKCFDPNAGDGELCVADADGDGFYNSILPSCSTETENQPFCRQDNCPLDYNPDQDARACEAVEEGSGLCPAEVDSIWNILWNDTYNGLYDTQSCSGNRIGIAIRLCMSNGEWAAVNVTQCRSPQFSGLQTETAEVLSDPLLSTEERIDGVTAITGDLANATDPAAVGVPLFPQDLAATNRIVSDVVDFLIDTAMTGSTPTQLNVELVQVLDNVLDERNMDGWTQIQERDDGGEMLLANAEFYGQYLVTGLMSDSVETGDQDQIILNGTLNNIVLDARAQSARNELKNITFQTGAPDGMFSTKPQFKMSQSQILIPASLLRQRAEADGSDMVSTVNIAMINIEQFLPDAFQEQMTIDNDNISTMAAAIVVSSQIITSRMGVPLPGYMEALNTTAQLAFTTYSVQRAFNPRCAFWNFSDTIADSGWSTVGVATLSNTSNPEGNTFHVVCESQHLTSFSVLVDVTGEELTGAEQRALEIVSYIGCAISLMCLLLTIIFFLTQWKELFTHVHLLVHLNLAISLFLGYATFVAGIETASSSLVGCKIVASLLHYFFLSAFSWMLFEGVMLYLLLVVVFSKLARRWWLFLLLGWGLPVIVVAISVGIAHDQYGVKNEAGEFEYCWISVDKGAIWAFVGPILFVIAANVFFWIMALRALYKVTAAKQYRQHGEDQRVLAKKLFVAAVVLLPLLGLTWVFGLLTVNRSTTVFAWLFTILNSLQGLFIFIFHVLRNDKVWKRLKLICTGAPAHGKREMSSFSSRRITKQRKRTTKRQATESLALSSDAVIVFENPSVSSPFDKKWKQSKRDEIGLTTRTWIA